MKRKRKSTNKIDATANNRRGQPTVFEQLTDVGSEIAKAMANPSEPMPAESKRKPPGWSLEIIDRLRKTVLKPILKAIHRLRSTNGFNWRDFGRLVGVVERYKTFVLHDAPRIWEAEFGDVTEEECQRIEPRLGLDKLRVLLIQVLNRPVSDDEPLEKLGEEFLERVWKHFEKLRQDALYHVAQQDAKNTALFYVGMAEGYRMFLNEDGGLSGDKGRTDIYLELIACQLEIEKMRRMLPAKSRGDLYNQLKQRVKFPPDGRKWFNDICDEIGLSMKSRGRPHKFSHPQTIPVM